MNNPLIVELLYHEKNKKIANNFKTHTAILRNNGKIVITENTDITENAVLPDIVAVFISAELLADDLLNNKVLYYKHKNKELIEAEKGEIRLFGLRVSAVNLTDHVLNSVQLLPRDSKQTISNGDIDERMTDVVRELRKIVQDIQNNK
jgi:exosome complex RNA-binding protein Csl4